jgi:hypothetical protein
LPNAGSQSAISLEVGDVRHGISDSLGGDMFMLPDSDCEESIIATYAAVESIVDTDTMWANDTTKQSDTAEAQYGRQLIVDSTRTAPQDTRIRYFRETIVSAIINSQVDVRAHAMSFSLHEDLAEQWCRYGDFGRGYSIVVGTAKINRTVNLLSLRVLYDPDEQRVVIQTLVRALETMP